MRLKIYLVFFLFNMFTKHFRACFSEKSGILRVHIKNKRSCCTFHFTVGGLKKLEKNNNFIFRSSHDQCNLLLFAFITV